MWASATDDNAAFVDSDKPNVKNYFLTVPNMVSIDLSGFDTGNVNNMWCMFENCCSLARLDLSSFDTGNATDMGAMFYNCWSLKEILVGDGWKVPDETDIDTMFAYVTCGVTHKP